MTYDMSCFHRVLFAVEATAALIVITMPTIERIADVDHHIRMKVVYAG